MTIKFKLEFGALLKKRTLKKRLQHAFLNLMMTKLITKGFILVLY